MVLLTPKSNAPLVKFAVRPWASAKAVDAASPGPLEAPATPKMVLPEMTLPVPSVNAAPAETANPSAPPRFTIATAEIVAWTLPANELPTIAVSIKVATNAVHILVWTAIICFCRLLPKS
jgi:hypothetical protein